MAVTVVGQELIHPAVPVPSTQDPAPRTLARQPPRLRVFPCLTAELPASRAGRCCLPFQDVGFHCRCPWDTADFPGHAPGCTEHLPRTSSWSREETGTGEGGT